jgi:hypothetical protein
MQPSRTPSPAVVTVPAAVLTGDAGARYGAMSEQVQTFLTMLRRIPIGAWGRCADRYPCAGLPESLLDVPGAVADVPCASPARPAWERLRLALGTMPGVASRICRRVDEELGVCDGMTSAGAAARMRVAAQLAAAALAARPLLSGRDFEQLYAPFATLIPPTPGTVS